MVVKTKGNLCQEIPLKTIKTDFNYRFFKGGGGGKFTGFLEIIKNGSLVVEIIEKIFIQIMIGRSFV
jgi:hypothetical protein